MPKFLLKETKYNVKPRYRRTFQYKKVEKKSVREKYVLHYRTDPCIRGIRFFYERNMLPVAYRIWPPFSFNNVKSATLRIFARKSSPGQRNFLPCSWTRLIIHRGINFNFLSQNLCVSRIIVFKIEARVVSSFMPWL